MNVERFARERQGSWAELSELVTRAGRRPERLGAPGVRRMAALYREAAADLALARRLYPRDPVAARLEALVGRAWHLVYDTEPRRETAGAFFRNGYWGRIRERPAALAAAAALLFGPLALAMVWGLVDPANAGRMVPEAYRAVTEPRPRQMVPPDVRAGFAGLIFTNNIRVSFLAFAGGIAACFGTAYVLVFNGLFIGALAGLATQAGNGPLFASLVLPHGVLELSCIVVTAAAGLRMGWALVDPGRVSRGRALVAEGRRAIEIVLGTVPWFVLAGLIEGFITPSRLGAGFASVLGVAAGGAFWVLVFTQSRARERARR